jgi:hypothetical protein
MQDGVGVFLFCRRTSIACAVGRISNSTLRRSASRLTSSITGSRPGSGAHDKAPVFPGYLLIDGERTPQTCGFRDQYRAINALGAEMFGVSTQTTQLSARDGAAPACAPLKFSDAEFRFTDALHLPCGTVR